MKVELILQNSNDGNIYDISELAETIEVSQSITGEAGKLTCTLQKDPNEICQLANGSYIRFKYDGQGIFFGYVFKIDTDESRNFKITAYDQLRYLKNADIYMFKNMTASDIFKKICTDYGLKYKIKVPSYYKPEPYVYDNKTLYSIIERGMNLASINEGAYYYIVDRFGTLTWSELSYEKTDVQLGSSSLMTAYQYEKSIDNDTYNQVKMYRDNKDTGRREIWYVKDSNNIKKWGVLQLLQKADDDQNEAQVKQTAQKWLKVKNRQTKTLKVEAEGVIECTAGRGIKFVLPSQKISTWMWIKSSTHTFNKYSHTMSLELEA